MNRLYRYLNHISFRLSFFIPRARDTWLFIGWHRGADTEIFADNTKYLFLYMAHMHRDFHVVWLAKDRTLAATLRSRGYTAHYERSARGIWYALRAGTTVIDAYLQPENYRWSGGTRLVQLLHGKGMKKGGYAQAPLRPQDYIVVTSPFVSSLLPATFVEQSHIIIAGYPRDDVIFSDNPGSDIGVDYATRAALANPCYKKRYLYAPTFRRGKAGTEVTAAFDLLHMSRWLEEHAGLLVLQLHPKYRDQARTLSYPNIHFAEDSDIYPLLPSFDVLITDYSSIFTDYLLLDRPIVFYAYDLDDYAKNEGLAYDSYDAHTPGPKAYTYPELISALDQLFVSDAFQHDRARIRDLYHTYSDGRASERILAALEATVHTEQAGAHRQP
ncbi:MAG: CDP-glycerol glycerophosphotransferase family protein [Candidatus Paceibacterota bacterium]